MNQAKRLKRSDTSPYEPFAPLASDPMSSEARSRLKEQLGAVAGLSELFRALSDDTRTTILYLLSLQELCVRDIAEVLEMSLPAVSHHLRLLKMMHLVKSRRNGKMVFYSLDDDHVLKLIQQAKEHFEEVR